MQLDRGTVTAEEVMILLTLRENISSLRNLYARRKNEIANRLYSGARIDPIVQQMLDLISTEEGGT